MQEIADPARSLARARETWRKQGRSAKWVEQRMTGQETHYKLSDYWATNDIKKGDEFAILTNLIHQEWSGVICWEWRTTFAPLGRMFQNRDESGVAK
jgi:DNA-damage-inducible protein D